MHSAVRRSTGLGATSWPNPTTYGADARIMDMSADLPTRTDVLVVGAGPAGSAAAAWLARQGLETVLADAAVFPRDKTCGDGLTPRAIEELNRLGLTDWVLTHGTNRGLRAARECAGGRGDGVLRESTARRVGTRCDVASRCAPAVGASAHSGAAWR